MISVAHIYTLDRTCLLAEYLHQLILGEYLRVTTIMKNMATIIQAFENDKQYEIELISIHRIPYFRLLVYGVLTTVNYNCSLFYFFHVRLIFSIFSRIVSLITSCKYAGFNLFFIYARYVSFVSSIKTAVKNLSQLKKASLST